MVERMLQELRSKAGLKPDDATVPITVTVTIGLVTDVINVDDLPSPATQLEGGRYGDHKR